MRKRFVILTFILFILTSCSNLNFNGHKFVVNTNLNRVLILGSELPDFKQYVTLFENGKSIAITDEMIDASRATTSKIGTFEIIYTYLDQENKPYKKQLIFTVISSKVEITNPKIVQINMTTTLERDSDTPDFKNYIKATDYQNQNIIITNEMVDTSQANLSQIGSFTVTYHVNDYLGNTSDFEIIFTVIYTAKYAKVTDYQLLKDQDDIYPLNSLGEAKILVLPIDFPNDYGTVDELNDIKTAFFGNSAETDFESVASYYQKSSFDKLHITGTVMNWYRANRNTSYYNKLFSQNQNSDQMLIKEAVNYHIKYNNLNLADYDLDDDGYVDAIWAIYSSSIDYEGDSMWWAYQYYFNETTKFSEKMLDLYAWASVDFIKEDANNINARTFIHETGHLLGLDDYYDYDDSIGANGGLGGADMMDYTNGDHNSFSKLLLGWVNPYLLNTKSVTFDLMSFSETGDVLLIPVNWNNSIFDEYYLIEYYTPTRLNRDISYLTANGIRILHVKSDIGPGGASGSYETIFNYDNSDTSIKLLTMVRSNNAKPFKADEFICNNDLFVNASNITFKTYQNMDLFSLTINYLNNNSANITVNILN